MSNRLLFAPFLDFFVIIDENDFSAANMTGVVCVEFNALQVH